MARPSLTDLMRAETVERWARNIATAEEYHLLSSETGRRDLIAGVGFREFCQAEARAAYRAAYCDHARLGLISEGGLAFG